MIDNSVFNLQLLPLSSCDHRSTLSMVKLRQQEVPPAIQLLNVKCIIRILKSNLFKSIHVS